MLKSFFVWIQTLSKLTYTVVKVPCALSQGLNSSLQVCAQSRFLAQQEPDIRRIPGAVHNDAYEHIKQNAGENQWLHLLYLSL